MKKRLICFAIAVVMLFSASVCVFAAKPYSVKKYASYIAIGDSVAAGYVDDAMGAAPMADYAYCRVDGSYPDLVASATSAVGEDNFKSFATPGARTVDLYYFLGGDLDIDAYKEEGETYLGDNFGLIFDADKEGFCEDLKTADLVTVGLGYNDIFTEALFAYFQTMRTGEADQDVLTQGMIDGFKKYFEYYPKALSLLKKAVSKNCTVLVVNMYNPLENISVTEYNDNLVGLAFNAIFNSANALLRIWARQFGFTYVDVTGVVDATDCFARENIMDGIEEIADAFMKLSTYTTHPNDEAHAYIAECIIDKLPESLKKVSIRTGGLVAKIGNNTVGKFNIARGVNGWTIQDTESGLYVSYENGKIELASAPTEWQYNGGFYVETVYSVLFIKHTQRVYLGYKDGALTASLLKQSTEFYKAG